MTNTEERQLCWKIRDFYLTCLSSSFTPEELYESLKTANSRAGDDKEIIPIELRSENCNKLREEMYAKCPLSWVTLLVMSVRLLNMFRRNILRKNLEVTN